VVLNTHEADIARWAERVVRVRDGLIVEDTATLAEFGPRPVVARSAS
jgi:hypothetical protein